MKREAYQVPLFFFKKNRPTILNNSKEEIYQLHRTLNLGRNY